MENIKTLVGSFIRHGIVLLGGWLVSKGVLHPDTVEASFINPLTESISGIALVVAGLAWSFINTFWLKKKAEK